MRIWLFALLMLAAGICQAADEVDFGRDIQPILSDKCYHCHGPDEKSRRGELRLDTEAGAFRKKDGVGVIVPGKSQDSELIIRIMSADPEEVMPPRSANRDLSTAQKELLQRWIDQGARWGTHWSFMPVKRPTVPVVQNKTWPQSPIDHFVLAKLEERGQHPAPEADKETLLRRITLDLTGLPPTPNQIDQFLQDTTPEAYERVVDQLLEDPRFGERMAVDWLDLARYADTHGYQFDRFRPVWPYRDWVIRAFNQNLPYDQFVTWQIAGDLLPNATKDQRLATAFNRLHMQNEEGGVVEEEFRVAYVVDRVNTFGTAFLGLTLECSRCHDHKYDPISQKDFYSLFSFFQNIDESGQTSYFTGAMPVPTLLLSDDATDLRLQDLEGKIQAKTLQIESLRTDALPAFQDWLKTRQGTLTIPGLVAEFAFDAIDGNKVPNGIKADQAGQAVEGPQLVEGKQGQALALNGENGVTFPQIGHFTRVDSFSLSLWLQPSELAPRQVVLHHSRAPIDAGSRGYELLLENGHVAFGMHHMWPGNSLKVRTQAVLKPKEWSHVTVSYDGSSRTAGVRLFIDGMAAELEVIRDGLFKDITYGGEPDLAIGWRFRDNGFKGGLVDDFRVHHRPLTPLEVASIAGRDDFLAAWSQAPNALTEVQRQGLFEYFFSTNYSPAETLRAELLALRKEHNSLINPIPEMMVMKELPTPKPAYVLKRGAYDAPGEPVVAGTPAALPPFPADQPRNRLGLAKWLLDPSHPLTTRVTVNRFWQLFFRQGLVSTSDNFGNQGDQPTHRELLDWLAMEFSAPSAANASQRRPWDVKQFLKLIAMSATYRQSSWATSEQLAADPGNQWLGRGPAKRMTAEMLRDSELLASGLLVEKRGGPSVKPYQPSGLWEIAMGRPVYDQGHGDDLYRRSLYTFWKRTVPPPAMITFDAADRNVCVVKRQATATPLHALIQMNDVQAVEAARFAAQRMLTEGGIERPEQISWLFRNVIGRKPVPRETEILLQLLQEQRTLFEHNPEEVQKLLAVGESKPQAKINPVDLAAATVLASTLMNLDEFSMVR